MTQDSQSVETRMRCEECGHTMTLVRALTDRSQQGIKRGDMLPPARFICACGNMVRFVTADDKLMHSFNKQIVALTIIFILVIAWRIAAEWRR